MFLIYEIFHIRHMADSEFLRKQRKVLRFGYAVFSVQHVRERDVFFLRLPGKKLFFFFTQ